MKHIYRFHVIRLNFEAEILVGELIVTNETTDVQFFDLKDVDDLDLMGLHRQRIADAMAGEA